MNNLIDYAETLMAPIAITPFSPVDSLVLSQFAYLKFEKMPQELFSPSRPATVNELLRAELFPDMFWNVRAPEDNRRLLFALAASPRFRDIRVCEVESRFDPEKEQQFFAVTYLLPDGTAYTAFRGTDATLVGWKEDFNMAFISPIPSQTEAVAYCDRVHARLNLPFRTGGHSKGGNLAVYAAVHCAPAVQKRLLAAFSHDGPGFLQAEVASDAYQAMTGRIQKTLPQSSLIGMMLDDSDDYDVVESSRFGGLLQHDPFSWEVENGAFVPGDRITAGATGTNRALQDWLGAMSTEDRAKFVDSLFSVVGATDAQTLHDLGPALLRESATVAAAVRDLDPETRAFVTDAFKSLGAAYVRQFAPKKKAD